MWRICLCVTLQPTQAWRKYVPWAEAAFTYFQRFHHSLLLALRRSMLLRSAASALLRTSTEISPICLVSTVRLARQSLGYPPKNRPFSTSVCLCKKKKKSLWLQQAEGQTMDGNIEEILAPLRLAVKEQVTVTLHNVCADAHGVYILLGRCVRYRLVLRLQSFLACSLLS